MEMHRVCIKHMVVDGNQIIIQDSSLFCLCHVQYFVL